MSRSKIGQGLGRSKAVSQETDGSTGIVGPVVPRPQSGQMLEATFPLTRGRVYDRLRVMTNETFESSLMPRQFGETHGDDRRESPGPNGP